MLGLASLHGQPLGMTGYEWPVSCLYSVADLFTIKTTEMFVCIDVASICGSHL